MIAVLAAIAVMSFAQGLMTETKTSGGPLGEQGMVSQGYYMPKMFKTVSAQAGTIIFRMDKQKIYEVNATDKTYSETTFDEWEAGMKKLSAKQDAAMGDLQKKLEGMPKEQREMVEKMMGDKMGGAKKASTVEVKPLGEKKAICGFAAAKYSVQQDGKEVMTVWATKEFNGYAQLKKDYEEFSKRMMSSNPAGVKDLASAFAKMDGFPLEMEFSIGLKTEALKIQQKSIEVSEFDVPAGFKKVPSHMMEQINKAGGE
jgi:hypothetical protein